MRGVFGCLLLAGLSQAAKVYLSPSVSLPSRLSPKHASLVLSHHLGLEQFESLGDNTAEFGGLFNERAFVGEGERDAVFLVVDETYANDILPSSMEPSFSLLNTPSLSSLSSLVSTYLHRASHVFSYIYSDLSVPSQGVPRVLDIFSTPSPANEAFLAEVSVLTDFMDTELHEGGYSAEKFAALELSSLAQLAVTYGRSSEQYQVATQTIKAFIDACIARKANVAVLTSDAFTLQKRQQPPGQSPLPPSGVPQPPPRGIPSCFNTAEACTNATDFCSGHGQCSSTSKRGQECFVCTCSATSSAQGKTQYWAGEACERKDVSGPFVLISGVVITLIVIIGGSISLLYGIGDVELPNILTGGVAGGRKE
ncbi:hypothetical protein SERLA73DRAFT_180710 [Serpula lacrymans var. lacrymans S7.3]|uniref:Uncharacterized protein n=2 Tax=Serpula lacrymans var. lacrymans TaxID=341189 RepID=F8PW61_SERL3|nr:uncharacterized protein SERLADRAFT_466420 [Serpula lacrymans var. lacrymans S7.9]EGO00237.1 hypothetical protein SERLA73DRAFT_180710 [Serpula lacrymans var. lacrymans S7.3]EGO25794.1 hypothetical protein SERLADRAFT_466420 [Serpula lacrymans var. lacrymans S7.9]